ncbi:netrin-4-like [Astyanax mexicanus]|uniref:Netrin-4-like n=1 Tax=Astyanax mexicanus TaxID=7994 RepID=A0A8T2KN06_ASTMX|nr:netrin-4-like [Astyanax mexicanus]
MKSPALPILTVASILHCVTASRCAGHACSPPVGNLAAGRTLSTLHTHASCCNNSSIQEDPHPPDLMVDDPFLHPNTWWDSGAAAGGQDEIHLNLEDRFCLTHVVMVFRSPRPAAMSVERSRDFGRSWEALKLFAENCSAVFGEADDVHQQGALCTSRYSSPVPCTGGEVIYRSMGQAGRIDDPYSPEALSVLTLTNLRIRLLKPHHCRHTAPHHRISPGVSGQLLRSSAHRDLSAPYAVYSLLARGTCLCHGHAEHCLPAEGGRDAVQTSTVVQGRCVCAHHTAGAHCERCAPLYNDRPWRAANGSSGEPNPCQKCECHSHAQSCHFSQRVWRSTGGISGGVCDNCQHNTVGRRCQRCRPGYHRHPARPLNSPQACTRCWCDPVGSVPALNGAEGTWCHPRSGQCHCKPGVGGTSCGHCLPGHWGFGLGGCRPCTCPLTCDPVTGHCSDGKANAQFYNVPIGGKIPDLTHFWPHEEDKVWSKELAVSALYYTGKCNCKERKLKSVSDLCKMKHSYVIKASVLSAHDKGTHAVVQVKVRKVLRSGLLLLSQGTHSLYPLSWTSRGCTCPVLNPGVDYLLAGPEEVESGRLLVTMQSLVVPWTPTLGFLVSEALRQGCI